MLIPTLSEDFQSLLTAVEGARDDAEAAAGTATTAATAATTAATTAGTSATTASTAATTASTGATTATDAAASAATSAETASDEADDAAEYAAAASAARDQAVDASTVATDAASAAAASETAAIAAQEAAEESAEQSDASARRAEIAAQTFGRGAVPDLGREFMGATAPLDISGATISETLSSATSEISGDYLIIPSGAGGSAEIEIVVSSVAALAALSATAVAARVAANPETARISLAVTTLASDGGKILDYAARVLALDGVADQVAAVEGITLDAADATARVRVRVTWDANPGEIAVSFYNGPFVRATTSYALVYQTQTLVTRTDATGVIALGPTSGETVFLNGGSGTAYLLPSAASRGDGFYMDLVAQQSSGNITVAGDTGVTVNAASGAGTLGPYVRRRAIWRGSAWYLS